MVEPLEETRSELTFVTEYITSSLSTLINPSGSSKRNDGSSRPPGRETSGEIDLDEVEIQKGTLQIAKALTFLHQQAKMVHLNISPEAILINAKVRIDPRRLSCNY
jgi:SCY1-like protein 2